MRYKYPAIVLVLLAILLIPIHFALAFCPVCIVAVGAGLGLARYLGVDDTVTGLWIGGFLIAVTAWTILWLKEKKWTFPWYGPAVLVFYYASVMIPLYYKDIIGHPMHQIWGIDKLVLSISLGSVAFVASELLYEWMKKKNGGKAHFQFQKVVMPILVLVILSFVFYFVTKK
jgi:hypothetical protein